jgi:hypothetical protein
MCVLQDVVGFGMKRIERKMHPISRKELELELELEL